MLFLSQPGANTGINVKNAPYGAVGDGVADDLAALQAAVNDAAASKTSIYIPAGTYKVSNSIMLPAGEGYSILGSGWGTSIKLADYANHSVFKMSGAETRMVIRDLTIDGNFYTQNASSGICSGIEATGAVQCRFENIHFTSCRDDGLYLGGMLGGAFGHNNIVSKCLFDQSLASPGPGRGIQMNSSDENQIISCDFEYLGGLGAGTKAAILDLAGTQQIVGCNFVNGGNGAYSIRCQDAAANTKIVACNFDGNAGDCVFLATTKCSVTDCTFFEIGIAGTAGQASGVHLEYAAQDNKIHDNTLVSSATNGQTRSLIREENIGGSGSNSIQGNILVTKGTMTVGPLDLNAPGTLVRANKGAGTTGDPVVTTGSMATNVKDFGAKGDGTTDDTAAIQSAITSLGSQGGTVFLPPGNYLLNGASPLNLNVPVNLQGAGHGATSIRIGASFTGTSAITVSSDDCMIQGLQLRGASSTTTSNPACHGVTATGVQETRIFNVTFQYVNGYALRLLGTAATTLHGTQISMVKMQSCAGAIHVKSDPTATAANVEMNNVFTRWLGVPTGPNANLDGIRIEDSWDVLCQNILPWMNAATGGTGAAFRVTGNCAAIFVQNLDALGPQTGQANVVIESGVNGDPQNVQIQGGVIQQGLIGLLISGASNQVRIRNMRILNNQTHNVSITTAGSGSTGAIYLDECSISQGGQGATGTNYDVNWTGAAEGFITNCRFGSSVVATGTAGVQGIINIASGTVVRVRDVNFAGTGSSSTNWFPGIAPQITTRVDGTNYEFRGNVDMQFAAGQRLGLRPNAAGNNLIASNVQGIQTVDNFRLNGDGSASYGAGGSSARDTSWGRQGAAQIGTPDADIVIGLAGKTLKVQSGTNAKAGTVTVNGTTAVTVSTTAITANSVVVFGLKTQAGTAATTAPFMSAVTAGTSFAVKSSAGDTSTYNWMILDLM